MNKAEPSDAVARAIASALKRAGIATHRQVHVRFNCWRIPGMVTVIYDPEVDIREVVNVAGMHVAAPRVMYGGQAVDRFIRAHWRELRRLIDGRSSGTPVEIDGRRWAIAQGDVGASYLTADGVKMAPIAGDDRWGQRAEACIASLILRRRAGG